MINENKIAAIIVAAGFSSRIKAFKPLLPIGLSTIIETAIHTFHSMNIGNIIVVTGYNAEALESHIEHTGAVCLRSDYVHNKMFDSACIGLGHLKEKCDMFFFTPVDSPLFTRYSIKAMISRMRLSDCNVLCPCYRGEKGHPLLIRAGIIDDILSHDGTEGMKGAVIKLKKFEMINLPDPALIMDADTCQAYEAMKRYERERAIPSREACMTLHEDLKTPADVIAHCEKVASVADAMAESIIFKGVPLDRKKISAAALLHDIARTEKDHAARGETILEDLGHTGISPIVGAHMELDEYDVSHLTEKSVVYLADKIVFGNLLISIKERFGHNFELYKNNKNALETIRRKYKQALQVDKMIRPFLV